MTKGPSDTREQVKAGVPVAPQHPAKAPERKAPHPTRPELRAMNKIDTILAELTENEQTRIVAWVVAAYIPGTFRLLVAGNPVEPDAGQAKDEGGS